MVGLPAFCLEDLAPNPLLLSRFHLFNSGNNVPYITHVLSIGGAGVLDGIFLTGIVAALIA